MKKCIFRRGNGCFFDSIVTTPSAAKRKLELWRKRGDPYWGTILTDFTPEFDLAVDSERPDAIFTLTSDEKALLKGASA